MVYVKNMFKRIIFLIILISFLISFISIPQSYAKLELEGDEFYYTGVTEGEYVTKPSIFGWLLNMLGEVFDYLIGICTMMPRMVFVGWTALFERLLTDLMEASVGVGLDGDNLTETDETTGKTVVNHTKISDPENNITVQAIVFNKVPAFNINFFQDDTDFLYSCTGTGRTLYCMGKDCKVDGYPKTCEECCGKEGQECSCGCGPSSTIRCANCRRYMANVAKIKAAQEDVNGSNRPAILILRDAIATWYYVLRLLSIAAMLVALIAIGIKMALSTIASDKAVYKRMLVDWVAGMIIVFGIQYVMIFIIDMNEILVAQIEKASTKMHAIKMQEETQPLDGLPEDGTIKKTNADLEINIYELIKTRAYDPKLSVGLTGMIMYMTLVYFAVRYSIVYFKRFFTIAILILVGPPLGVAYALQRTLTGKSVSLKLWFSEFLNNVIIQTVHALIYGIFIATSLVLSIQSIAGMLVALVLMNFGLKADKLFRRIFKFGNGGGIADSNAESGSTENIKAAVGTIAAAKPVMKALNNTPYMKALKGTGKATLGLAGKGGVSLYNKMNDKFSADAEATALDGKKLEAHIGSRMKGGSERINGNESDESYQARHQEGSKDYFQNTKHGRKVAKSLTRFETVGMNTEATMTEELANLIGAKKLKEARDEQRAILATLLRETKSEDVENAITLTRQKLAAAEANLNLVKPEKESGKYAFDQRMKKIGKQIKFKSPKQTRVQIMEINENDRKAGIGHTLVRGGKSVVNGIGSAAAYTSSVKNTLLGTKSPNKFGRGSVSNHDSLLSKTSFKSIMGLTDEDMKDLKEQVVQPSLGLVTGGASFMFGCATLAASPKIGMGLLANSGLKMKAAFTPEKGNSNYTGKYTFKRFDGPTLQRVQKSAARNAKAMSEGLLADAMRSKHPEFVSKLRNSVSISKLTQDPQFLGGAGKAATEKGHAGMVYGTLVGTAAGLAIAPPLAAAVIGTSATVAMGRKFMTQSASRKNLTALARKEKKRQKEAVKKATYEAYNNTLIMAQAEIGGLIKNNQRKDDKTNRLIAEEMNPNELAEKAKARYASELQKPENQGLLEDGAQSYKVGSNEVTKAKFGNNSIQVRTSNGRNKTLRINDQVSAEIDKRLQKIAKIETTAKSSSDASKKVEKEMKKLDAYLVKTGLMQKTDTISSKGKIIDSGMSKAVQRKTVFEKAKEEVKTDALVEKLKTYDNSDINIESISKNAKNSGEIIEILKQKKEEAAGDSDKQHSIDVLLTQAKYVTGVVDAINADTENGKEVVDNYVDNGKSKEKLLSKIVNLDVDIAKDAMKLSGSIEARKNGNMSGTDALLRELRTGRREDGSVVLTDTVGEGENKEVEKIELDKMTADQVVQILLMRKQMEEINEEAAIYVDEKYHSKKGKETKSNYRRMKLEYLRDQNQKAIMEGQLKNATDFKSDKVENNPIDNNMTLLTYVQNSSYNEKYLTDEAIQLCRDYQELVKRLKDHEVEYNKAALATNSTGVITDYESMFNSMFSDD